MSEHARETSSALEHTNFLFVGLSYDWSVRERQIISDMLCAREKGANVHLYALRDSGLASRAKELGFSCSFHQGVLSKSFIKWKRLKAVSKLINHYRIDIVHCYDIDVLWPLSYILKSKPVIPLILSLSSSLNRSYRGIWYGPLSRRLDQVIVTHDDMSENVYGFLGIPPIKVKAQNLGVDISTRDHPREKPFFKISEDRFYLGTHLSGLETSTTFLDPLFYALKTLTTQKDILGREMTCVLGSNKNWRECLVTEEVRRKVKDWGLEDYVAFMGPCNVTELQLDVDVWVDLQSESQLSDTWISSLVLGTPLIAPRTGGSMELMKSYPGSMELYRFGDTRDLRSKLEKILVKLDSYESSLLSYREELDDQFSIEQFRREMGFRYEKLIKRRKRLVLGRKKNKAH